MEFDLETNFCQCCLSKGIFKKMSVIGCENSSYFDMLSSCFSIMIENTSFVECLICDSCISRLEESRRFRTQVEDCQIQLSQQFKNRVEFKEVKIEYEDQADKEEEFKCNERMSRRESREKQKELSSETSSPSTRKYTKKKKISIDKSRTCDVCGELFASYLAKRKHINVHYPNFVCDQCGKPFLSEHCLLTHIDKHNDETVVCSVCNGTIKKTSYTQHMHRHTSKRPPFSCPHCGERFPQAQQRIRHLEAAHNVDIYTYVCKLCPKKYTNSSKLSRHVRRSHLRQSNCYCDVCGRGFFEKGPLAEHIALHTGEKRHACDVCQKTFTKRWNMQLHRKGHFKNKTNDK